MHKNIYLSVFSGDENRVMMATADGYETPFNEGRGVPNNNKFYDLFFIIFFLEKHGFPSFMFATFNKIFDYFRREKLNWIRGRDNMKKVQQAKSASKRQTKVLCCVICVHWKNAARYFYW